MKMIPLLLHHQLFILLLHQQIFIPLQWVYLVEEDMKEIGLEQKLEGEIYLLLEKEQEYQIADILMEILKVTK